MFYYLQTNRKEFTNCLNKEQSYNIHHYFFQNFTEKANYDKGLKLTITLLCNIFLLFCIFVLYFTLDEFTYKGL